MGLKYCESKRDLMDICILLGTSGKPVLVGWRLDINSLDIQVNSFPKFGHR